ncbi:MAG: class I SAM-dependent methyltransferase [Ruminococcaceae bacterium]|nr:class I SAM-dependent methyltransferase [Oscillospiraceae bacterium]
MMTVKGLEGTFDTVASAYEKLRPGYPDELYKMIFDHAALDRSCRAVEVGIGGGQATLPFLKTECELTAVEYGETFSALCKEKFKEFSNFSVITGKFEDVDLPNDAYDLVYSASAFHWVPEEVGYKKVFAMLKEGGVFARFANHPFRAKDNLPLSKEIDRIYGEYYYSYYKSKKQEVPVEYTEEQAGERAEIAEKYGFTDIKYALFHRTRTFSADEYCALLGTYSDHIAIEESVRDEFFSKIGEAIDSCGGSITLFDTVDLQLGRKV